MLDSRSETADIRRGTARTLCANDAYQMTRWQLALARIGAVIFSILFWVWGIFIVLTNWIGRSTAVDDFNLLVDRLPAILAWLFSTPWWVPAALAALLTGLLVRLALPSGIAQVPADDTGSTESTQMPIMDQIQFRIEKAIHGNVGVPIGESHVWIHAYVKNTSKTHLIDCRWEISADSIKIVNSFNLYAGEEEERFLFELRVQNIDGSITGIRRTDTNPFEHFPDLVVVKSSLFSRELGYVEKVFGVREAWDATENVIVTEDHEIESYFRDLAEQAAADFGK
jgi:hypothetical protein